MENGDKQLPFDDITVGQRAGRYLCHRPTRPVRQPYVVTSSSGNFPLVTPCSPALIGLSRMNTRYEAPVHLPTWLFFGLRLTITKVARSASHYRLEWLACFGSWASIRLSSVRDVVNTSLGLLGDAVLSYGLPSNSPQQASIIAY
jgi:hypothetical protein